MTQNTRIDPVRARPGRIFAFSGGGSEHGRGVSSGGTPASPSRVGALLALPALLGSECSFSLGSAGLPVREIVVVPSAVELPAGARAGVEAIGRDRLGGRVEVRVAWESDDPEVATVVPDFASHTVITAAGPGDTRVVATHRTSGARDTVEVTVTPVAPPASARHTPFGDRGTAATAARGSIAPTSRGLAPATARASHGWENREMR